MIEHIILTNQWKYPVYFSSTVPPDSRLNLDNHLKKAGFGLKLVPEEGNSMFDVDEYHRLLWEVYKYRGLNDVKVYKDENAIGMLVSYPEMFVELSSYYLSAGEREKAKAELEKAIEVYPEYYRPYTFLSSLYKEDGKEKEADSLLKKAEERLKSVYQLNPQLLYLQYLGLFYISLRKTVEAEDIFYRAYKESPDNVISVRALSDLYIINGKFDRSIDILEKWLKDHPDDQAVSNVLQKLRTRK
jgi:tetratricopeptide (TPR) repeat protein